MDRLVQVVQELSMARDLATIMAIVRRAARELTGADGSSFVLRDGDECYYADEDAIEPLWKGKRFPIDGCISGWAMQHREAVVIDDIYSDDRIPAEAYRPTFVRSLVMIPIRKLDPIGAIGNYWKTPQHPSDHSVRLLQTLADSTAIAMANVDLVANLEARVAERTAQLEATNRELEAFSFAVSHDLRAPLRAINGFSKILLEDHGTALGSGRQYLDRIRATTSRMGTLIDDLLRFSQIASNELDRRDFDLADHARDIIDELRAAEPARHVEVIIPATLRAHGDTRLVRVVLENLLGNAWKYTSKREAARIELGSIGSAFFVRDNGAGFDPAHADKLFMPFQRLHAATDFEGTGVGLAIAQRIVHRHGGRIWADSAPGRGATFYFSLGQPEHDVNPPRR